MSPRLDWQVRLNADPTHVKWLTPLLRLYQAMPGELPKHSRWTTLSERRLQQDDEIWGVQRGLPQYAARKRRLRDGRSVAGSGVRDRGPGGTLPPQ